MIDEIQVRNVALIKQASLVPSEGLTVLTGETGAGKTALLSALRLLMGARADKDSIRDGESALEVSGRFFGMPAAEGQDGKGADASDGELVVTRRVSADGRSRVTLDGSMASVRELAARVASTIDLCGQHDQQQLMKLAAHVRMLDAWAGEEVSDALAAYKQAFSQAKRATEELERVLNAGEASSAKLDEARFALQRIDAVNPHEGEYEELAAQLARAEHAEALAMAANRAHEALGGDEGALDLLNSAVAALDEGARFDADLGALADSLREAGYVLEDVARSARDYRDGVEFNPEELEQDQERMSALQGLLRAYGPRMCDVLQARAEAADLVSAVDDAAERERAARANVEAAEQELAQAAQVLDNARSSRAPQFAQAVSAQMGRLEMGGAELLCEVRSLPRESWTSAGPSEVEFLFRPGAGMQARPLARIASGGETSRVMLAIKVVLGQADSVDTLVFDEVDAGVGGSTAVALADVLADLARTHQVIVVTHLAQVAVRGQVHYTVRKVTGEDGKPQTSLQQLDADARPAEIARMLSGDETQASLAHAREMLDAAAKA